MLTLSPSDINAIQQIHQQWMDLEKQGKGLDVLQFCTDDVRWLVPNSEILVGKAAARSLLDNPETEIIEISTHTIEMVGNDSMAYKTSRFTTRFTTDGGATEQVVSGTHLWILHKQTDGQWRVALVTWQCLPMQ